MGKEPLSDIPISVFSLVSPFRKCLFNTSLVSPFPGLYFVKAPAITLCFFTTPLLFSFLGKLEPQQTCPRSLSSRMPSFISTRRLPALCRLLCVPSSFVSLRLFQILLPTCKWTVFMPRVSSPGHSSEESFFSPTGFYPPSLAFILENLPSHGSTGRWAVLSRVFLTLRCHILSLHHR